MKELIVKTVGYSVGDEVFTTQLVDKEEKCTVCNGVGKLEYHVGELKCLYCHGTGLMKLEKKTSVVLDDPFVVRKVRLTVNSTDTVDVKYTGVCGGRIINRPKDNLFDSREEAQKRCDYLNREKKIVGINEILIYDNMKETVPNAEKLKDRYEHYVNNKSFKKNIVINEEGYLVDGYITYLICKMLDVKSVIVFVSK